jgi:transcription elongation factor Elf1
MRHGDAIEKCNTCGHDVVAIGLLVDGSDLQMFSCDNCDKRSWRRAGLDIDLADALGEFETHAGRRR